MEWVVLIMGEFASASVINKLRNWFYDECRNLISSKTYCIDEIMKALNELVLEINTMLNVYGKKTPSTFRNHSYFNLY